MIKVLLSACRIGSRRSVIVYVYVMRAGFWLRMSSWEIRNEAFD